MTILLSTLSSFDILELFARLSDTETAPVAVIAFAAALMAGAVRLR